MEFGKSSWRTFEQGIEKEWLLTNGIGGFASSTIIGANTRRYHGLLIASLNPPVSRHMVVSKINECVELDNTVYQLSSHQTPGHKMEGYLHLHRAVIDEVPTFIYNVQDMFIEKKVCMVYGKNTVAVVYNIINGSRNAALKLAPLVNFRDYHHNSSRDFLTFHSEYCDRGVTLRPSYYDIDIKIQSNEGNFVKLENCYFSNMEYAVELERGLSALEDHFIPGYFKIDVRPGEEKSITIIASVEKDIDSFNGWDITNNERERVRKLKERAGYTDELAKKLVAAADSFIVYRRSTGAKTIIAGYPWFTDWGRDTMIALPGLTLATGRFEDAKEILYTFSRYIKNGLIPNMFPDEGQEPAYNTVDAPLWYFEAVNKYIYYTRDYDFIYKYIYSVLKEIVHAYINGTMYDIQMDSDHLITAGNEHTQLTWMDAKVGDWVVTPRHGKAVEINALWYNALRVIAELADKCGENGRYYSDLAYNVKNSFISAFWNDAKHCLYDVILGDNKDDRVRPNQIFAVGLSNPVVEGEKAKEIVDVVARELYTAYGLRSLSPSSREYTGVYAGDNYKRDGAYHQGTVWTWPMGYFISALIKTGGNNQKDREKVQMLIRPFWDHLHDACVGSISEIFDGNEPLVPRGCFAQAWSVGEILRAYSEYILK